MPIYAYKCSACGHEQDVLQKMSDPVLTDCPQCQQSTYVKQLTAAAFQLKGTGWYVTDFRDNAKGGASPSTGGENASGGGDSSGGSNIDTGGGSSGSDASGAKPASTSGDASGPKPASTSKTPAAAS